MILRIFRMDWRKKYARIPLATVIVFLILAGWAAHRQFGKGFTTPAQEARAQGCQELLTLEDFRRACPSSANRAGLRVAVDTEFFKTLYKCSISVTSSYDPPHADGMLHIAVDVFFDPELAWERMIKRTYNNPDIGEFYGNIAQFGNVIGLGEISALDTLYKERNLLLLKEYAYAEVMPTGGNLCPEAELFELGRSVYGRLSELKQYSL